MRTRAAIRDYWHNWFMRIIVLFDRLMEKWQKNIVSYPANSPQLKYRLFIIIYDKE